ncbi:hypothetical protein LYZ37_14415 [Vibrio tubiashii]|uniref:hypothetical protein n=1 Tax=Vibrio tubiashii TaxID=29498 RepID=UPI00234F6DDF|nr:hypothetical protein [Vibrio tubiashii]WCP67006.1 hypothetical protein LYZ37_14415 [Vibrio tubiashii]
MDDGYGNGLRPTENWKTGKLENWKTGKLENWKTGKLENWKTGKLENWKTGKLDWKTGKLENWKTGKLENWKTGKLENWKTGKLENWMMDVCLLGGKVCQHLLNYIGSINLISTLTSRRAKPDPDSRGRSPFQFSYTQIQKDPSISAEV